MGPFGEFLKSSLKAHGMSVYVLCKKLGKSTGNVSNIMHERPIPGGKAGSRYKPPLNEMDRWADAIGMNDEERGRLKELADMAQLPPSMQSRLRLTSTVVFDKPADQAIEHLMRAHGGGLNRAARMEFGTYVDSLIKMRGLNREKFATLVGQTIGKINGILDENPRPSQVLPVPLDHMSLWAEKLNIDENQIEKLHELAELTHTPAVIYNRYLSMKAMLAMPQNQAASSTDKYAAERRELDTATHPDDYARPPAPTYPRPAPIRGGSDG